MKEKHKYISHRHVLLRNCDIGELYVLVNDQHLYSRIRYIFGVQSFNQFYLNKYSSDDETAFFIRDDVKYFFVYKPINEKIFRLISFGDDMKTFRLNECFHYMSRIQHKFFIDEVVKNFFFYEKMERFNKLLMAPLLFITRLQLRFFYLVGDLITFRKRTIKMNDDLKKMLDELRDR